MKTNNLHEALCYRDDHAGGESKLDRAKRAVASGCDVNAHNEYGWTALHYAVSRVFHYKHEERLKMIHFLLAVGADPRLRGTPTDQAHDSPIDFVEHHIESTTEPIANELSAPEWEDILHLLINHQVPPPRRREAVLATREKYK